MKAWLNKLNFFLILSFGFSFPLKLQLVKEIEFRGHLTDICCGDINSDGLLDILVADFGGKIHLFINKGKLEFERIELPCAEQPIGIRTADVNSDGKLDIVTTSSKEGKIIVFYQLPEGKMSKVWESFPSEAGPYGLDVGDINKDGYPDVIVANIFSSSMSFYLQRLEGKIEEVCDECGSNDISEFEHTCKDCKKRQKILYCAFCKKAAKQLVKLRKSTLSEQQVIKTGAYPYTVRLGDLNGDNLLDIAQPNYMWAGISIFYNKGGRYDENERVDFYSGNSPSGVAIGDINGDGRADIVSANLGDTFCSVFYQQPDGVFMRKGTLTTPGRNWNVWIEDIDGDKKGEIFVALENVYTLMVFKEKTEGEFENIANGGSGDGWGVFCADVDGDKKKEILVSKGDGGVLIFKLISGK